MANVNNNQISDNMSTQHADTAHDNSIPMANQRPTQNQEPKERSHKRKRQEVAAEDQRILLSEYSAMVTQLQTENAQLRAQNLANRMGQEELRAQNELSNTQIQAYQRHAIGIMEDLIAYHSRTMLDIERLRRALAFAESMRDNEVRLRGQDASLHAVEIREMRLETKNNDLAVQTIVEETRSRREALEYEIQELEKIIDQKQETIDAFDTQNMELQMRIVDFEARASKNCDGRAGSDGHHSQMMKKIREQKQEIQTLETVAFGQLKSIESLKSIISQNEREQGDMGRRIDELRAKVLHLEHTKEINTNAKIEELSKEVEKLKKIKRAMDDDSGELNNLYRQLKRKTKDLKAETAMIRAHHQGLQDRIDALENKPEDMDVSRVQQDFNNRGEQEEIQNFQQEAPEQQDEDAQLSRQMVSLEQMIREHPNEITEAGPFDIGMEEEYREDDFNRQFGWPEQNQENVKPEEEREAPLREDLDTAVVLELIQYRYGDIPEDDAAFQFYPGNGMQTRIYNQRVARGQGNEYNQIMLDGRPQLVPMPVSFAPHRRFENFR